MLNFQSIGMRPPDGQSLQSSSSTGVRLLAGQLPDVQLGVEIPARIIEMVHGKALLQLAESTIQIEQPPGAQEGAQVIIRLLQDSPQPLLDVRVVGNAGPASASSWQVGQELVASVIGQSGEHQLLLETQGTQLDAVSPHDFPVGSALKLQVDQVEPQIVLLVIDHFPNVQLSALQVLRTHLQAQVPMGESIAAIEQAIEQLHQDSSSAGKAESDQLQTLLKSILPHAEEPESDRIAEYVRNGGLNYEAKLAGAASAGLHGLAKVAAEDFKGAALKLLQALELEGKTDAAKTPAAAAVIPRAGHTVLSAQSLAETLRTHLNRVETQQALNVLAKATDSPLQVQFPFMTHEGMRTAYMAVKDDEQGDAANTNQRGQNVLLQLDLQSLGQTRIDVHVMPRSLRAIFYAETSTATATLEAGLDFFGEHLRQIGYQDVWLAARQAGQLPDGKKEQFRTLSEGVLSSVHLVDERA